MRAWWRLVLVAVAFPSASPAVLLPGGGRPSTDCWVGLELGPAAVADPPVTPKVWKCTDGAPCDRDGACNGRCRLEVRLCVNQSGVSGCAPLPGLAKVGARGRKGKVKGVRLPRPDPLFGPGCGDAVTIEVPARRGDRRHEVFGARAFAEGATRPRDRDVYDVRCLASDASACPPASACGDGVVGGDEQCDPSGGAACPGGGVCDETCRCGPAPSPCRCGVPDPTLAHFTTSDGTGRCGVVLDDAGESRVVDADGTPGLDCGGLYFGGRGNSVPLPAVVPNLGTTVLRVARCDGTTLHLAATSAAESGSERTCTSAGCLFGAPLPIVNPGTPATSTCIVNTLTADASGTSDCAAGRIDARVPLASGIHLAGDTLFRCLVGETTPAGETCGSDAECGPGGVCPTGTQPCPICIGPAGGASTCHGGPNDGLACTPGTTTPGEAYPTSHDCPPAPGDSIGAIAIALAQTTEEAALRAVPSGTQRNVFCGYCRDADDTLAFTNPARACASDAECSQPFEACEQNESGAFAAGGGRAATVSMQGARAGDLRDRQPHSATLVSVFCVPPTFEPVVDNAANLPGPGAVSLPGAAQLLPAP